MALVVGVCVGVNFAVGLDQLLKLAQGRNVSVDDIGGY